MSTDTSFDAMKKGLFAIVVCLLIVSGCNRAPSTESVKQQSEASQDRLLVYAVNAPLAWMAGEIGGTAVEVIMPIPAGIDPAYWQPEAQAILPWQDADLILLNGAGYASWLAYASLPAATLLDTSAALSEQYIPLDSSVSHTHGPQGEHSHAEQAFTLWLDLHLAGGQADAIYREFAARLPEQQPQLQQRYLAVAAQLEKLDKLLLEQALQLEGRSIVYSHPVYQYFSRRYALPGISVHWEPDREPGPEQWQQLQQKLGQAQRPLMIWEAKPLPVVYQKLQKMGVEVLVFEPGASVNELDFSALMEANVERMKALSR